MKYINLKIIIIYCLIAIIFSFQLLSACIASTYTNETKSNEALSQVTLFDTYEENIASEKFSVYDFKLLNSSKILLIKSHHQVSQMLGVVVVNNENELIIFDGGRVEDSKFLRDLIVSYGGKVKYWFLSHIHDDHIGAIFDILNNYKEDVYIENICYNFADFTWYYDKVGDEAYVSVLFDEAKNKYVEYMLSIGKKVTINQKIKKGDIYNASNVDVKVMNDIYLLDSDPINNSSIVYKAYIEDTSMIVLGDLAYYGGYELLDDYKDSDELKSDIVVISHHGQSGVDFDVYKEIAPKIALWPTTKNIYENKSGKFKTDMTKKWMNELLVDYNILSYPDNAMIK